MVEVLTPDSIKKKKKGTPAQNLELAYAASRGDTHDEAKLLAQRETEGLAPIQSTLTPQQEAAALEMPRNATPTTPEQTMMVKKDGGFFDQFGKQIQNIEGQTLMGKIAPLGGSAETRGKIQAGAIAVGGAAATLALPSVPAIVSATAPLAAKVASIPLLAKIGLIGIGSNLVAGEVRDMITGEDSRGLANEYDIAFNKILTGVKSGSIDVYQAQSEMNRITADLNELAGSFNTGLKVILGNTEGGRRLKENIANSLKLGADTQLAIQNFIIEQQQLRRQQSALPQ
jgi:hypothetical protein